ncbi:hypothetical protein DQ238_05880 [Geodermatophilus sp. TF02-6]|uniref:LPXTG cell wall anchor domain-containing protein n=1 Tax=Geodermatophilus sp. TF02-6 TaxID=2250575 RepID=UPI000DE99514|nr:LPXTG cell wall anchor domain-containing protein [Geodermatophilus sp. TF02-6]RBY82119.1 hypothetical protein DQ238_05880 [Geodermatophilus sp. TF02-6]
MSRTTTRIATLTGFTATTAAAGLLLAPAALASPAAPTVAPSTVTGEQTFTVSGTDCPAGEEPNPNLVAVVVENGGDDGIIDVTYPEDDGTWSLELAFAPDAAPGTYAVHSACMDYLGFYSTDPNATPTPSVEYPDAHVTLAAATATPSTPTTTPPASTPSTPAGTEWKPGATPNTPGIASTNASGTTGSTAAPGTKVVKVLKGFKPHEVVTVVLHSTPVVLGTFTADAQGVLTVEFTLPAGTPEGTHHIAYDGTMGSHFEEAITVSVAGAGLETTSSSLAYTGADIAVPLAGGVGLVLLGGATVFAARRRKEAPQV